MDRKIKIVQFGCGRMAMHTMQYAFDHGADVVAAFDVSKDRIGQDIGDLMGIEKKSILVQDAALVEEQIKMLKPDICVITTRSLMADLKDIFMICAKNGVNAISTCEEALYPWNSSVAITKEIDEAAKNTGCTICGSGAQELQWGSLINTVAGGVNKITKIKGSSKYNVEDYGIALAHAHGAGLDVETFEKVIAAVDNISIEERVSLIEKGEFLPSYMWNSNGWLCDKLGLTVKSQIQKCVPILAKEEMFSSTLNETVAAGKVIGMAAVVNTITEEGIEIEGECIGKIYGPEDYDTNDWTLFGEPDLTISVPRPATIEMTCAVIINRIPDVINAPAGFVTTSQMPTARYIAKSLHQYVNK